MLRDNWDKETELKEEIEENKIDNELFDVLGLVESIDCPYCNKLIDVKEISDRAYQQAIQKALEIIEELKTRNINDKGIDIETEEYWINEKELTQKLNQEKKK